MMVMEPGRKNGGKGDNGRVRLGVRIFFYTVIVVLEIRWKELGKNIV